MPAKTKQLPLNPEREQYEKLQAELSGAQASLREALDAAPKILKRLRAITIMEAEVVAHWENDRLAADLAEEGEEQTKCLAGHWRTVRKALPEVDELRLKLAELGVKVGEGL